MNRLSLDPTFSEGPISARFLEALWIPVETVSREIEDAEMVGEGRAGQVWLVTNWETRTGFSTAGKEVPLGCTDEVVVKIMKPEQHPRFGLTLNEEQQRALNREAKVALEVAKLNLPHVVKLHGYTDCAGAPPDTALAQARYALVMEYCELGCLKDVMRKLTWRNPAFKLSALGSLEKVALEWQRLVQDLSIIDHAGIVLQDISPGNILLTGKGVFKFCYFGYSWLRKEASNRYAGAGTNLCRSAQRQQGHYDPRGDLFALGMVLLSFFTSLAGCPFNPLMLTHLKKCESAQQADLRQLMVDTVVLGHRMMRLAPQLNIVRELEADSVVWYLGAWILLLCTLDCPGMPSGYHLDHAEFASLLGDWHLVALKLTNIEHGEAVLPALAKLQSRLLHLSLWDDKFKDGQLHWMALEYATLLSPIVSAQGGITDPLFRKHIGVDNPVPEAMMRMDSYTYHFYKLRSMDSGNDSKHFSLQQELMLSRSGGLLPGFAPGGPAVPSRAPKRQRSGECALPPQQASSGQQVASRQIGLEGQHAGPQRPNAKEQADAKLEMLLKRLQQLETKLPGLETLLGDKEQGLATTFSAPVECSSQCRLQPGPAAMPSCLKPCWT